MVVYELEYRKVGDAEWEKVYSDVRTTEYEWDVSHLPSGKYEIRLRAHDTESGEYSDYTDTVIIDILGESKKFRDYLYERLPEGVRYRDDGSIRQLIDVLGEGLAGVYRDIDNFAYLVDVDNCPAEMLPHLGAMLGFEFPYDLPEEQQRNFIRSTVSLYRIKGTPTAIKFLASRMIGGGFRITIENEDHVAKTFDVRLEADEGSTILSQIENKVAYLVNIYSPAGMIPHLVVAYFNREELPNQLSDAYHTTTQFTSWRLNFFGHRINDNIRMNDFGTVKVPV